MVGFGITGVGKALDVGDIEGPLLGTPESEAVGETVGLTGLFVDALGLLVTGITEVEIALG